MLSINGRGQIVIPKEVRKRANIQDGNKLALVSGMNRDEISSLASIRTANLSSEVSGVMDSLLVVKSHGVLWFYRNRILHLRKKFRRGNVLQLF